MRRMYSKEQLNKLIEEVSKLIAIEELDKVVPVPSLAKAGYYMAVNAAGTGYELVASPDQTHLYYHGLDLSLTGATSDKNSAQLAIINNSATAIDTIEKFQTWYNSIEGAVLINANGCIKVGGSYKQLICFYKVSSTRLDIYYVDSSTGMTQITEVNITDYFDRVSDRTNQLL